MPLSAGTRLGPYEIISAIGEGGMGEVYRARDTKLNRDVAIKVLLPAVANDPDRLARFSREAQVLASLNHPNIAQIYGLSDFAQGASSDKEAGHRGSALVMELVEGPTLAERLQLVARPFQGRERGAEPASAKGYGGPPKPREGGSPALHLEGRQ